MNNAEQTAAIKEVQDSIDQMRAELDTLTIRMDNVIKRIAPFAPLLPGEEPVAERVNQELTTDEGEE
jgi:uncharacterized coiled-coil protein SlyX